MEERQNWSKKLVENHRITAALKSLREKAGTNGSSVSVKSVAKAMPLVGVAIEAGMNGAILRAVVKEAQLFSRTRFLAEKYGLPIPVGLGENPDAVADGAA